MLSKKCVLVSNTNRGENIRGWATRFLKLNYRKEIILSIYV